MFGLYILTTFAALVLAAAVSPARGRALWLALLLLCWGIGQFNTLLEAVFFAVMPISAAAVQLFVAAIAIAIFAALAVTLAGKWRGPGPGAVRLTLGWQHLVGVIVGYEILYFGAGTIVWPFVAHFYTDKPLPSVALVAALQIPRSLVFMLAALPWLRTGPRHAPLVLAALFALIAAIAPMFPDNPYMPADVRFAHGVETGVSNFLFGILIGWLLRPRNVAA